jgi:peptidoglycan/xylan/chitin deacetylase (PgdA/CDA1 family)
MPYEDTAATTELRWPFPYFTKIEAKRQLCLFSCTIIRMIKRFAQKMNVPILYLLMACLSFCVSIIGGMFVHFSDHVVQPPPKDVHASFPASRVPVKVPILVYHYVEYVKDKGDTIRQGLDIVPSVFENQIQTLIADSYTPITIDTLADYLDGKAQLPPKPIILTFDDGYKDFYTDVLPLLVKYHVKAVAYIVPDFLDKPNFMTTQQLRGVGESGLVEIAAHTLHHVNLKSVNAERAQEEISESKTALEKILGKPVHNFAYPYGDFNQAVIDLVKKAGYRTAVSVVSGTIHSEQDRYFVYRLRTGARIGTALTSWLEQDNP